MKKLLLLLLVVYILVGCENEGFNPVTCGCVFIKPSIEMNSYSLLHDTEEITNCSRDGELRYGNDFQLYELECQTLPFNWNEVNISL
jgi:hypothetical protein